MVGAAQGLGCDGALVSTAWLVTGARGQLGHDLLAVLADRTGDAVTAVGRAEMDLTDEESVRGAVRAWLGSVDADRAVVVNAAAYTAVDAAEDDEATALVVNGHAPGWLAEEMAGRGRLVHVSTDYVFDGTATEPYPVDAPTAPRSAYGRTKAAGERAVHQVDGDAVVVRTAWVYGRHGGNFVRTMTNLEAQRETISVVDDQIGSPTWSRRPRRGPGRARRGRRAGAAGPALHERRGRSAGTASPGRCSRSSVPTRRGCCRRRRPTSCGRPPARPTPCSTGRLGRCRAAARARTGGRLSRRRWSRTSARPRHPGETPTSCGRQDILFDYRSRQRAVLTMEETQPVPPLTGGPVLVVHRRVHSCAASSGAS